MTEEERKEPLYEFYVAGVQHHKLHTCIKELEVGQTLALVTEPSNTYDPNAVRIEHNSLEQDASVMLGYVPMKKDNLSAKITARLMHQRIRCEVLEVNPEAKTWEQLKVGIFVEEN